MDETVAVLCVLETAYPSMSKATDDTRARQTAALWHEMFADDPGQLVAASVKAFIAADRKGFPPAIGQIKAIMQQLTQPQEMTAMEAWALVARAIRNSTYHSGEMFEGLPPVIRRLVGGPAQLREWAGMPTETVESVVASNFRQSYNARMQQEREYLALPSSVREIASRLGGALQMPPLPDTEQLRAAAISRLEATCE